jgi:ATP-dependent helicase/nuclease subunit B
VSHPSEALDPSDPKFLLRVKPRGVFDGTVLPGLDASLEAGASSDVVQVRINKDGRFARTGSDVTDPEQFRTLLEHVRKRMGELADGILGGEVSITPYRLSRASPCPRCEYRPVCRFDATINRYNNLAPMKKEQVLEQLAGGDASAGGDA